MVKCELCGKEFKNNAGLAGHKQIAHPDPSLKAVLGCIELLDKRLSAMAENQQKIAEVLERQDKQLSICLRVCKGELILAHK